jgi:predicted RNA polymerase sigma factor
VNDAARAVEAVWRGERPQLIAGVTRLVRDLDLAEDLAHDALVAALEHWPRDGVPDNPGAWLMATAKHRALDRLRQATLHARRRAAPTRSATTCCASCSPPAIRCWRPMRAWR